MSCYGMDGMGCDRKICPMDKPVNIATCYITNCVILTKSCYFLSSKRGGGFDFQTLPGCATDYKP